MEYRRQGHRRRQCQRPTGEGLANCDLHAGKTERSRFIHGASAVLTNLARSRFRRVPVAGNAAPKTLRETKAPEDCLRFLRTADASTFPRHQGINQGRLRCSKTLCHLISSKPPTVKRLLSWAPLPILRHGKHDPHRHSPLKSLLVHAVINLPSHHTCRFGDPLIPGKQTAPNFARAGSTTPRPSTLSSVSV